MKRMTTLPARLPSKRPSIKADLPWTSFKGLATKPCAGDTSPRAGAFYDGRKICPDSGKNAKNGITQSPAPSPRRSRGRNVPTRRLASIEFSHRGFRLTAV